MQIIPVILCGGSGTRLWPLSRSKHPKQFVDFGDGKTLFQKTLIRASSLAGSEIPIVVGNIKHLQFVQQNLSNLNLAATLVIEPASKDTAAAIALAALTAQKKSPNALLFVLPSDHEIDQSPAFQDAVNHAIKLAQLDFIVTFGVIPTKPETGFGYIEQGVAMGEDGFVVKRFVEKPSLAEAEQMLLKGGFYWNSGMFVFKTDTFLKELKLHASDIYHAVYDAFIESRCELMSEQSMLIAPKKEKFDGCACKSIDYAVMEKTSMASVVPLATDWKDLGTWSSLFEIGQKNVDGNVTCGDVISLDTHDCYINSTNRLIATIGLKDLAVVETKDAVFISALNRVQDVKTIVKELNDSCRSEANWSTIVIRPWGSYETLTRGNGYQTKKIIVRPGGQLSLQLHHHRSEHWTVVEGNPVITVGDTTRIYRPNESVYIPKECVHRITNSTDRQVTIIEVQCGDYLGEDDIVRL